MRESWCEGLDATKDRRMAGAPHARIDQPPRNADEMRSCRRRPAARRAAGIPIAASRPRFTNSNDNEMSVLHDNNEDLSAHPGAPAEGSARGIRNVLVVDDNVDAADSLAALLAAWGYAVTIAHDGPAALAALQDTQPDIALLDIGLPAMDGYELAAHLRFQPGCEDLPVVAITGSGGPEDVARSRRKGFAAHLVKPVSPASLRTLLK
jgi:CheY-like chemotaxis protein